MFDSQKLLMQTENYIIVWKHHSQNNKGYEIDRVKAIQDIQKYGKQYYYEQHFAGKYDIKESHRS